MFGSRLPAGIATSKNGGVESSKKSEEDLGESIDIESSMSTRSMVSPDEVEQESSGRSCNTSFSSSSMRSSGFRVGLTVGKFNSDGWNFESSLERGDHASSASALALGSCTNVPDV